MIKLSDLSFGYDKLLFSNLNLQLPFEQIILLQGANGSGKTTLCRLLSGLETNYTGSILLNGESLSTLSAKSISQQIIYFKQEPAGNTVAATPDEDLAIWQGILQNQLTNSQLQSRIEALYKLQVDDLLHTPFWEMSGGQIKRSALAALLLFPNKYWILDEPTSGLHDEILTIFNSILEQRKMAGSGALIISHKTDQFASVSDQILRIKNEKINEKLPLPI